jgi:hypothetical protein
MEDKQINQHVNRFYLEMFVYEMEENIIEAYYQYCLANPLDEQRDNELVLYIKHIDERRGVKIDD